MSLYADRTDKLLIRDDRKRERGNGPGWENELGA